MGGLLATHLVLRNQAAWAGLILCSAAIDIEWSLVTRCAIPVLWRAHALEPEACWHSVGRALFELVRQDCAVWPLNRPGMVHALHSLALVKTARVMPHGRDGSSMNAQLPGMMGCCATCCWRSAVRTALTRNCSSVRPHRCILCLMACVRRLLHPKVSTDCQSCLSVDGPSQEYLDWCGAGSRHRSEICWRCWCPVGASCPRSRSSTSATTRRWCVRSPVWLHAAPEGDAGASLGWQLLAAALCASGCKQTATWSRRASSVPSCIPGST